VAFHENPLQEHVSGWSPKDFEELGYRVHGVGGWRRLFPRKRQTPGVRIPVWDLIYNLSEVLVVGNKDESKYMFCIKEVA
jgi:hypothetical protein